jgi:hypothetical protein
MADIMETYADNSPDWGDITMNKKGDTVIKLSLAR